MRALGRLGVGLLGFKHANGAPDPWPGRGAAAETTTTGGNPWAGIPIARAGRESISILATRQSARPARGVSR